MDKLFRCSPHIDYPHPLWKKGPGLNFFQGKRAKVEHPAPQNESPKSKFFSVFSFKKSIFVELLEGENE